MRKKFEFYSILCFLLLLSPLTPNAANTIEANALSKFTVQEVEILNSLEKFDNKINLNFSNDTISNKNGDLDNLSSSSVDKNGNHKIKTSDLSTILEKDPSLVQIQVFDIATNE